MRTYLLDVNVLIALLDPAHINHDTAHDWFSETGRHNWATCPITENAVVRILSNPGYPSVDWLPQQPSPWEELKNQVYLGDDGFVAKMQEKLRSDTDLSEIPLAQRRLVAKPREYYVNRYQDRDRAICEAYSSR